MITPEAFGALGDTRKGYDGTIAATFDTFNSVSAAFDAPDIGKRLTVRGAGTGGRPLFTSIVAIIDPHSVQVADVAQITVSGAIYLYGTDDTAAVQAALDAAASDGDSVKGKRKALYMVDVALVKQGTESVNLHLCGTGNTDTGGVVRTEHGLSDCDIRCHIDMSAGWTNDTNTFIGTTAIFADGVQNCHFDRCAIDGVLADGLKYGLFLYGSPGGNTITRCRIEGAFNPTIKQNLISIQGNPIAFGGYLPSGTVAKATHPALDNIVSMNILTGGSYAIILGGAEDAILSNNICKRQNHRGIYLGPAAWNNLVSGNQVIDYYSSGIIVGYGSYYNVIQGNRLNCDANVFGLVGEASININAGAGYNYVLANSIDASKNYGIYLGPGSSGCQVVGNTVRGYLISGIHVDSDWSATAPAHSQQRPNYATPGSVCPGATAWTFGHTQDIAILSNQIGAPHQSSPVERAAISLSQVGTTYWIQRATIAHNAITDGNLLNWYVNVFETLPGGCNNNKMVGNTFDMKVNTKFFFTRGLAHFNAAYDNDVYR